MCGVGGRKYWKIFLELGNILWVRLEILGNGNFTEFIRVILIRFLVMGNIKIELGIFYN